MSFVILLKVTLGPYPRDMAGCQEDQLCDYRVGPFSPTVPLLLGERGWRLSQPKATDFIH